MKLNKKRLKEILEIPGVSGRENKVSNYLEKFFLANGFEIDYDNLGSIIATKKSTKEDAKKLLIDAHIDEVGFMITDITEEGLIRFESHGYVNEASLLNQRVKIYNDDTYYIGVISYPMNPLSPAAKAPIIEKMYIDLGARSKKEVVEEFKIKIGNIIVFDSETIFNKHRVITKAADDRAGVSLLMDIAEYVKDKKLPYDLILVGSVQEEVGIRGARTTTYKVNPDLVFTIDTSPAKDFPVSKEEGDLGKGTFLRHKDALHISSLETIEFLETILKTNKIKYQDYFSSGGTNAYAYSLIAAGTPVVQLGFLVRNIHSSSVIFDLDDYKATQKLLVKIFDVLKKDLSLKIKTSKPTIKTKAKK